ncbi:MAG: ABC transporter ATP-binding protein [bacterium]
MEVISDLSLTIDAGEFVGLLGPNGAGKSTLLHTISGQMQPDSGKIEFAKKDIYQFNLDYKKQIGFVHEAPFFYDNLTSAEFLHFVAKLKTEALSNAQTLARLEQVNLAAERDKLTFDLSMGMRKKLAIAAALIGAPKIIFLDEALNGIDFESAFRIKTTLKEFIRKGGTVILSTHVLEVVEKVCDRLLLLKSGALVSDMTAEKLQSLTNAATDLEAHLISLMK